jgi:ATP-dependent helicase/nuclease subunit A
MTNHLTEEVLKLFTLNEKQREAAIESGRDIVVTAGAGSGKTSTLVARYACLLAQGTKPRRIAAITFTVKAAQEMRARVRSTLMRLVEQDSDEDNQHYWSELSTQIDSARIGTIHSLCAEILRNHPAEAGVDPRFNIIDQGLAKAIRVQVIEDTLAELIEEEKFLPLLFGISVRDLTKLLGQLLDKRLETVRAFENIKDSKALLIHELKQRMNSPEIRVLINQLREISPQEIIADAGEAVNDVIKELLDCWSLAERALEERDPVTCALHLHEVRRIHLMTRSGYKNSAVKGILLELREKYDTFLNPLTYGAGFGDEKPSTEAEALYEQLLPLLRIAFERVHQAYKAQLDKRQSLDFDDLEDYAHRLLKIPEVRERWQKELDAIMVDEYQDTNSRQRDILNALAGGRGCLFMVGDLRQSIYRFRRADVTVFRGEQERVRSKDGLLINLDRTYRAHEDLLDATGDLLSHVIGTEEDQARRYYVPYTPLVAHWKEPKHPVQPPHIEFIIGAGEDTASARPRAAQALAARLHQLRQEGQIKNWDEVALLFRASSGYPYYEEAFEDAGIPFVTVAGKGFYDRPEIRDLLNILRALADPLDDLAFVGLLRSPAFGLSDGAIYQLHQNNQHYWQRLQGDLSLLGEPDQVSARRVLKFLNLILPIVDRVPVAHLLKRVVDELDYRALLATVDIEAEEGKNRKTGGRLWRNLDKLLAVTQRSNAVNVRDFLELLETITDVGAREGEASAEAEGSVRLMTIHAAKGLEFPVVVLADAGRRKVNTNAISYLSDEFGVTLKLEPTPMLYRLAKHLDKDQDDCEDLRVFYVALTRAQSKLIINGHGTINKKGELGLTNWLKAIDDALGRPSLDFLTSAGRPFESQTINGYPVHTICVKDLLPAISDKARLPVSDFTIEDGLKPLYKPIEPPYLAKFTDEPVEDQDIQSWHASYPDKQVSGIVLGQIVHKAIQRWLFPGDTALGSLLESEALQAGIATDASRQEMAAQANELLTRFREHPLWDKLGSNPERYSELPYSYLINDTVENRIIDLLYRDNDGWHIIDFKTDPIYSSSQKEDLVRLYGPQVKRYRATVESKLGMSVSGQICFLDDHGKVSIVEV